MRLQIKIISFEWMVWQWDSIDSIYNSFNLPITAETACMTTRHQIIGRNMNIFRSVAMNACLFAPEIYP